MLIQAVNNVIIGQRCWKYNSVKEPEATLTTGRVLCVCVFLNMDYKL